jgi:3-deoxy-7-phosphoheptulonate synthase
MKVKNWTPQSWQAKPIKQQPTYEDTEILRKVEARLSKAPALIYPHEAIILKQELAKVARGEAFLLQGGDCAESFAEFSEANVMDYFRIVLQMTVALMYGAGKPVVKVGRIAGQFSKPRSDNMEEISGVKLPSYRGDMVNGIAFNAEARRADPQNLIRAYEQSGITLNYLRSLAHGGFASLARIEEWNVQFIQGKAQKKLFQEIIKEINSTLGFIDACGLPLSETRRLNTADFYVSHEALLLNYEEALTRQHSRDGKYYDCSAHMVWIGDRTRDLKGAHIEYMRGIANPIAVKVGPSMQKKELLKLIDVLDPENEAGRLTLISRMGADKVEELLPPLVEAVKKAGKKVIWSCDPMHGNTVKSNTGYKTRHFDKVLSEVKKFFAVHKAAGTYAGGIHIEMTGQDVTECLGGTQAISEIKLKDRYHTHCDPRLNGLQSLELALLVAQELQKV